VSKRITEIITRLNGVANRINYTTEELTAYHLTDDQLHAIMDASYRIDAARSALQRMVRVRNDAWHRSHGREEVTRTDS
jgi:hypothetical protein